MHSDTRAITTSSHLSLFSDNLNLNLIRQPLLTAAILAKSVSNRSVSQAGYIPRYRREPDGRSLHYRSHRMEECLIRLKVFCANSATTNDTSARCSTTPSLQLNINNHSCILPSFSESNLGEGHGVLPKSDGPRPSIRRSWST